MRDYPDKKEYLKTDKENTFIKITTFYAKGGINYYDGSRNKSGFYVSVQSVERKRDNGFISESFMMFSGRKSLIKEANRFSKKVLTEIKPDENILKGMIAQICAENNLNIVETEKVS